MTKTGPPEPTARIQVRPRNKLFVYGNMSSPFILKEHEHNLRSSESRIVEELHTHADVPTYLWHAIRIREKYSVML